MNKLIILVLGAILVLLSKVSLAFDYNEFVSCSAINRDPIITFKYSYGNLVHDLSLNHEEISRLQTQADKVAGLATRHWKRGIWVNKYKVKKLSDKAYCVMPVDIEVMFAFDNPMIYVANDYPTDTCAFSMIIRHEQTHQRINKLTIEYFLPIISKTAFKTIKDVRAVKVSSRDKLQLGADMLAKYYKAKMNPIFEEFDKALENEQKKLDNEANYEKEWNMCRKFDKDKAERDALFKK